MLFSCCISVIYFHPVEVQKSKLGRALIEGKDACDIDALREHYPAMQRFIALQFLSETALLTVSAGILGCILGGAASILINRADIQLGNSLLVQLFGGNRINAVLTLTNILRCLAISVALAFLGWLYPVHVAMESNPIVAMRGQV